MNLIPGYIEKHPQEAQRLVGLNYDQLKQLIKQAMRKPLLRDRHAHRGRVRSRI
ncbi:MAG: hypothetical protein AAF915_04175 [Cyanobacteria bacterium P01_D01_bin.50]